jgi:hypothetical protein
MDGHFLEAESINPLGTGRDELLDLLASIL